MSANDMREFLLAEGWVNDPAQGPWQWQPPHFPGMWYLLRDAYSLARALERGRAKKHLTSYAAQA